MLMRCQEKTKKTSSSALQVVQMCCCKWQVRGRKGSGILQAQAQLWQQAASPASVSSIPIFSTLVLAFLLQPGWVHFHLPAAWVPHGGCLLCRGLGAALLHPRGALAQEGPLEAQALCIQLLCRDAVYSGLLLWVMWGCRGLGMLSERYWDKSH